MRLKENVLWKNNISFKKDTEKVVLLLLKRLIQFNVKFRAEQICLHVSTMHQTSFWWVQNILRENGCVAILYKGMNWEFIFLWRKINWQTLRIANAQFRYAILFMISEKSNIRGKFLHRGARMHQESQQVKQKSCISEFLTLSAIK